MFNPVLPPTDESTCASKLVGIWHTSIPLIYVDATKPAKSPTTPPPNAIINDFLDKFILIQYLIISSYTDNDFESSPSGTIYSYIIFAFILFIKLSI